MTELQAENKRKSTQMKQLEAQIKQQDSHIKEQDSQIKQFEAQKVQDQQEREKNNQEREKESQALRSGRIGLSFDHPLLVLLFVTCHSLCLDRTMIYTYHSKCFFT